MKSVVVGTAGHIDHGKSALVQALTGTDPDRLKEEKARGITIDLGFAHLTIDDLDLAFVDVPGHERFVKNMLAGAGGIDLVVLVVAADESVMPQTREHFDICRLLRVPAGVIALTKADLADREMLDLVRLEVRELVTGSFLAGAPVVPVSARTGQGLDDLRSALVQAGRAVPGRESTGAARLPIDRVFTMKGFGTVVTGTLVSGRVHQDDELSVAPGSRRVKVRGVQVHGARVREAHAGQRAAFNLAGVEAAAVGRGQTLMAAHAAEETRIADVVLDVLADARAIKHGARVRFHQGTAEVLGRVAIIAPTEPIGPSATESGATESGTTEPGTATIPAIASGGRAYVRLRLEAPVVLVRGDRFIVRSYSPSRTIAGGRVLDPRPPRGGIRSLAARDRCRQLDAGAAADALESALQAATVMIEEAGKAGLPLPALVSRVGIAPGAAGAHAAALVARGAAVEIGQLLASRRMIDDLKRAIVDALTAHHRREPLSDGLPREEARVRLFARGAAPVFDRVLEDLEASGTIVARDRLALATHHVTLPPEGERARQTIDRLFREAGLAPPDAASLASAIGVPAAIVDQVVTLLQRQRVLVKLDTVLFHEAALRRLKEEVVAIKTAAGAASRIDVATFKTRFGVTRKFAIPLLEYLDRERVTRRIGDARVIL